MMLLDAAGGMVVDYTVDAWGRVYAIDGSMANTLGVLNPLIYRGYVYDHETGLYYLNSRYYDPKVGRFINADVLISTGQGLLGNNMFAYCRNNPVRRVDVTGMDDMDCLENDSKEDFIHKPEGGSSVGGADFPVGRAGGSLPSGTKSSASQVPSSSLANGNAGIPKNAYDLLQYIKSHNGSPPKGYKGGGVFANDGRDGSARLPNCFAPYRKYDIYPKMTGQNRGSERIVVGTGVAWYTNDHYMTFFKME